MEKEEKKKKIKLKKRFKVLIIIILIVLYAFFIGPKGIFIKEFKIETNKISEKMNGLKIIHFSDLHYCSSISNNQIKNIIKNINSAKPDIVIFTGDLIDEKHNLTNKEKNFLIKQLSNIKSNLGKFFITGEEDDEKNKAILNLSDFVNLNSNEQLIYKESNIAILLIGKDISESYFNNNKEITYFKILAIHNPNDFDKLKKYNFDLVLAGHTHNGQVNIPKIKELFIDSKYKKSYNKIDNTKMFINPGIGNSKINIRLFNHPTIYLYRLNKTSI